MEYRESHEDGAGGYGQNPDIQSHLAPSERILSVFGPFYATSYRVLRLDPPSGPSRGHLLEIPYHQLTSIEMVRRPNHSVLALGTILIILGLLLSMILFLSTILVLIMGAVFLYIGARGKPGYYQLYATDMPKHAERYWQVEYNRSGNFIATVRSAIGQMPDF
jgi:hypothetical protein